MSLSAIFQQCNPRPEILAGELPDVIFTVDLWDMIPSSVHPNDKDVERFFSATYPTENLNILVK